jgi:hypothetical protein
MSVPLWYNPVLKNNLKLGLVPEIEMPPKAPEILIIREIDDFALFRYFNSFQLIFLSYCSPFLSLSFNINKKEKRGK